MQKKIDNIKQKSIKIILKKKNKNTYKIKYIKYKKLICNIKILI